MDKIKHFFLIAGIAYCTLILNSCSDDDDSNDLGNQSDLVGTWYVSREEGYEIHNTGNSNFTYNYDRGEWYYVLESDGIYKEYEMDDNGEIAQREGNGTYTYDRNAKTLKMVFYVNSMNYEDFEFNVLQLNSAELIIKEKGEYIYRKLSLVK